MREETRLKISESNKAAWQRRRNSVSIDSYAAIEQCAKRCRFLSLGAQDTAIALRELADLFDDKVKGDTATPTTIPISPLT